MSETDVLKMKVADLKRELKLRGLSAVGNKTELQERLQTALLDGDLSLEDTAISEELLDEDVLTDEEEKAALESPQEEKSLLQESKTEEKQSLAENANQQTKKVVLKRKNSITVPTTSSVTEPTAKENAIPPEKLSKVDPEKDVSNDKDENSVNSISETKKVVKLSELSMKERLEMRAKKFGITANDPAPKATSAPKGTEKELQQIEALKKRAERFGCVLSSKIADIEKQEKLQKRQERFGVANNNTNKSANDVYAEKARLRLERFKAK